MIPSNNTLLTTDIEIVQQPTLTYKLDLDKKVIVGFCDGLDAMKQAIIKILDTERYDEIIYSWNYGTEMKTVYGEHWSYVCAIVQDIIIDALIQDDRIIDVKDFKFERLKNSLLISFTVETIFGDVDMDRRVNI